MVAAARCASSTKQYNLKATHERATQPGERLTHLAHLPPTKVPGLIQDRDSLLAEAEAVGPALLQIVQGLLADPVLYRIPTAGRLVRLKNRYGAKRLEAAARSALYGLKTPATRRSSAFWPRVWIKKKRPCRSACHLPPPSPALRTNW